MASFPEETAMGRQRPLGRRELTPRPAITLLAHGFAAPLPLSASLTPTRQPGSGFRVGPGWRPSGYLG